jgi:hypothetical protein
MFSIPVSELELSFGRKTSRISSQLEPHRKAPFTIDSIPRATLALAPRT